MPTPPATETNPSLKRPTFDTHAQPAMTAFIGGLQEAMAGSPPAKDNGTPPEGSPPKSDIPPAAPTAGATKAEPKPDERTWPRNAKDWDAYKKADKERLDKLGAEIAEWKTKYETAEKNWKSTPAIPPDYESIKKERDDLDQRLRTVAVEQHPKFQAYFDGRVKEQLDLAQQIGGEQGKEIAELLKAPDSSWKDQRLSDILTTLTPLQSTRIGGILNNLTAIASERNAEIARAKSSHDQLLQQEQSKVKERQTKAEQAFTEIAASLQDPQKGIAAYQTRQDDAKWNEGVKTRIESARNLLFGKTDDTTMIRAALDAAALPAMLEHAKAVMEENATLKQQLAELQAAQPTLDTNKSRAGTESGTVPVRLGNLAFKTPQDAAANWTQGFRQHMEEGTGE